MSWPEQLKVKQSQKLCHVLKDANQQQLVLNCKRFSYFHTHDIVTQNATHSNIMYLYRGHSASRYGASIVKGEGVDEESNNK